MVRQIAICVLFAGSIALSGCAPAAPTTPPEPPAPVVDAPADIAALNASRAAFMAAYAAGDAEAIGKLYTEQAISEPNNQPTLKGRDAIVASLKGMFAQVAITSVLTPDETRTLGSVGLDRGRYTVTVTPKAGAPPTSAEGRYMVVYVKEADGTWRVSRDMDNAEAPSTPTAEPGTTK